MAHYRLCSFYLAAYDHGKRSIFAAKRPCWQDGAGLKMQMHRTGAIV
jgi:hypothetical protein